MANLAKLEFAPLELSGDNYLSWCLDTRLYLSAHDLKNTIAENDTENEDNKNAQAIIFIRRHLHESLKREYLTIENPLVLWTKLKQRYDHQKLVILPKARNDWASLRLSDFKSINEYNSRIFEISSQLTLCGETIDEAQMIDKTLSTFHANNIVLAQQYRHSKYTKYCELISVLLVAEKENQILLKNHQTRPIGSAPLPEVNNTSFQQNEREVGRNKGGQHHVRRGGYRGNFRNHRNFQSRNKSGHQKWQRETNKGKAPQMNKDNICFKCGMTGHWSRTCRTAKHLTDLYQASIKGKGEMAETNFATHKAEMANTLSLEDDRVMNDGSKETINNNVWFEED